MGVGPQGATNTSGILNLMVVTSVGSNPRAKSPARFLQGASSHLFLDICFLETEFHYIALAGLELST